MDSISFFENATELAETDAIPGTNHDSDEDIESNCAYLGTPCSCTFKCY